MKKMMTKTIVSTNWLNKVIAVAVMALMAVVPTMAGNKKYHNGKKTTVVVVTDNRSASHFDKLDKRTARCAAPKRHAYHPVVKVCTFKVSRHAIPHHAVAKAERIHGVVDAHWNPRTHEMTVRYDARVTSARHIMHSVA